MMNNKSASVFIFTNKGLGVTPIHEWFSNGLDDIAVVTEQSLIEEYSCHFKEVYGVNNYFDDDEFFSVSNNALSNRAQPTKFLCYLVEADVERCAFLRDKYGISGLNGAVAQILNRASPPFPKWI